MIDLKMYNDKKTKGLVTLAKIGDAYAVSYKQFDPETGEELTPVVTSIDLDEVNQQKSDLTDQIIQIDSFLADINSLN